MAGGRGKQSFVVRIAAHHPVQYHDISWLDLIGEVAMSVNRRVTRSVIPDRSSSTAACVS